jgi:hypothetical protein
LFSFFLSWLFNDAVSIETNVIGGSVVSECGAVDGMRIDLGWGK